MPKRNMVETAHIEHTQMLRNINLKEVALGDNGERYGEHMAGSSPMEEMRSKRSR